jgi:hypothetical protein
VIQELTADYPVRRLCQLLDVVPSSYYYRQRADDDLAVLA